jgi:hypothetical protein
MTLVPDDVPWLYEILGARDADPPPVTEEFIGDGWLLASYRLGDVTVDVEIRPLPAATPRCGATVTATDGRGRNETAVCFLPAQHVDCPHVGVADPITRGWEIRQLSVRRPLTKALEHAERYRQ